VTVDDLVAGIKIEGKKLIRDRPFRRLALFRIAGSINASKFTPMNHSFKRKCDGHADESNVKRKTDLSFALRLAMVCSRLTVDGLLF